VNDVGRIARGNSTSTSTRNGTGLYSYSDCALLYVLYLYLYLSGGDHATAGLLRLDCLLATRSPSWDLIAFCGKRTRKASRFEQNRRRGSPAWPVVYLYSTCTQDFITSASAVSFPFIAVHSVRGSAALTFPHFKKAWSPGSSWRFRTASG
jgi:hypothetical protein